MPTFAQTTLVRYARWGLIAVSIAVTAACGGGGGGGGGGGAQSPSGNATAQSIDSINLVVNASRLIGVAPLAVSFDTLGTTAGALTELPFHEIKYSWDFGDSVGGAKWSQGAKGGVVSKNSASGPVAAHVFESHGTFKVTVSAFHGAALSPTSKTITVTVLDPNIHFKDSTLCISNTSLPIAGVDGCPTTASAQKITNWNDLSNVSGTYKRILLKRGETWIANSQFVPQTGPGILAAYGTGGNPIISSAAGSTVIQTTLTGSDWRIIDLSITSGGYIGSGTGQSGIFAAEARNTLILRCDISNSWINVNAYDADGLYIVDSIIHEPLDYGVAGPINVYVARIERLAMIGNRVYGGNRNHAVRIGGARNAIISHNTVMNADSDGHTLTLRGYLNSSDYSVWTGVYTEDVVVSDNVMDSLFGGLAVFTMQTASATSAERLRNIIVERNLIKGKNQAMGFSAYDLLTVRNNITITTGATNSLGVSGPAHGPAPTATYIYNNTFYKPDASAVDRWYAVRITSGGTSQQAKGTVIKNNISYSPGNVMTLFLSAQNVLSVDYIAENNSTDLQVSSVRPWSGITSAGSMSSEFLGSGYPINAGIAVPVWEDYDGKEINKNSRSMGAVTP